MMQSLAVVAMSARWRAVLIAAASSAAAILLPPLTSPLSYLGGAVVALVTLRIGAYEGLGVWVAGALLLAALGAFGGLALPLALGAITLWLPVWLAAWLLRVSRSLAMALRAVAVFGAVAVILTHLSLGDPAAWWAPRLETLLGPVLEGEGMSASAVLPSLARWLTALMAAALALSVVLSLFLGRAWQAKLYNPGGFGEEFRALALGRTFGLSSLLVIGLTQLPVGVVSTVAVDIIPTLVVVYLLQGLALVHAAVFGNVRRRGWLIVVYVLLVFAAPQAVPLVALAGWMDTWIDVRGRWVGRG